MSAASRSVDGMRHQDTAPPNGSIAIWAGEEAIRSRIDVILATAGYGTVRYPEATEGGRMTQPVGHVQAVVAAWSPEEMGDEDRMRQLRARFVGLPLLVVATGEGDGMGATVRRMQVEGLIPESELEQALVPSLEAVLTQQLCVPRQMREALARPVFSHREKQVLELLLAGLSNGDIAQRLYLSESTVKTHLSSSFRKLGVSSRAEAARRVLAPA